jgi:predicted nuclease of predicted toxin-antitoxin system
MARLLVDEGIRRHLVAALVAQGYEARHWLEVGPKGAHDSLVFWEAQRLGLTLFTLNRNDFIFAAICWTNWGLGAH